MGNTAKCRPWDRFFAQKYDLQTGEQSEKKTKSPQLFKKEHHPFLLFRVS